MSEKKKRQCLSFSKKYDIIKEVKAGASKKSILYKYGISNSTYYRLLENEEKIFENVNKYEFKNKKSSKTSSNRSLDNAMITWFKQTRDRGDPISGPILQEKASILNDNLGGTSTFQASNGWLEKFKKRYGIRHVRMQEGKLSNDLLADEKFSQILNVKLESENFNLDNNCNADESGILWRLLTEWKLALRLEEEEVSDRKESEDRETVLFCSNATDYHRIPLLKIGNYKIPRCLKDLIIKEFKDERLKKLESLGVTCTYQSSAWMDKSIFLQWFKDEFIPRVLEQQRTCGITEKIVNFDTYDTCQPNTTCKLEEISENPDLSEITHTEALEGLLKFKNWLISNIDCSARQLAIIEEFQNIITEYSEQKVYLRS